MGPDLGPKPSQMQVPPGHLEALLEENLAFAKDNNRLLRLIRRDALLGLFAKVILWLVILGVPLFLLGSYIGPLMDAFTGQEGTSAGVLGVPSKDQLDKIIEEYRQVYQP